MGIILLRSYQPKSPYHIPCISCTINSFVPSTCTPHRDKSVLVAEVGWPTASGPADDNTASVASATAFVQAWTQVGGRGLDFWFAFGLAASRWVSQRGWVR